VTFTYPKFGTNRRVVVDLYRPEPGDYGSFGVRRPIEMNLVKWRKVKLGDEV